MKLRAIMVLVLALIATLSLSVAQKNDATKSCPVTPTCCQTGSKASMSTTSTSSSTVMLASDKKSTSKSTTTAAKDECTDADKAQCDMKKASMTKNGTKSDCCKDKAKGAKAEKKSTPEKSEAKGAN